MREAKKNITKNNSVLVKPVTVKEVHDALVNMANGKQPGPDRLPNEMLKALAGDVIFCTVLAKLFTVCINSGVFSLDWKLSSIFKQATQQTHLTIDP